MSDAKPYTSEELTRPGDWTGSPYSRERTQATVRALEAAEARAEKAEARLREGQTLPHQRAPEGETVSKAGEFDPDCESCGGTGDQGHENIYKRCGCDNPTLVELRDLRAELAKRDETLRLCAEALTEAIDLYNTLSSPHTDGLTPRATEALAAARALVKP